VKTFLAFGLSCGVTLISTAGELSRKAPTADQDNVQNDTTTPPILARVNVGKQVEMLTQDEMQQVRGEAFDLIAKLPKYGFYGGPEYSGANYNARPIDAMDTEFMSHDKAYDRAKSEYGRSGNFNRFIKDINAADIALVQKLGSLSDKAIAASGMRISKEEGPAYKKAAIALFSAKIAAQTTHLASQPRLVKPKMNSKKQRR